jgi:hypothetical protein
MVRLTSASVWAVCCAVVATVSGPEFRKPTIEQLSTFVAPTYQALIDGARYCELQLRSIIDAVRPDVIVEDNVVTFPALMTSR